MSYYLGTVLREILFVCLDFVDIQFFGGVKEKAGFEMRGLEVADIFMSVVIPNLFAKDSFPIRNKNFLNDSIGLVISYHLAERHLTIEKRRRDI